MAEDERDPAAGGGDRLGPLPAGRHGYTREQVAHNQRERLLAAVTQVVIERGYNAVTIADITGAASVSRGVFYENFADKEACFLAAFDVVVAHLRKTMLKAADSEPDWPHKVLAALRAVLDFFAAEPDLARLFLVESVTATPQSAAHYREAVISFVPYLKRGRSERPEGADLPDSTEDSLLGALASLIARSLVTGDRADIRRLAPDFAEFLLTPYLGPERATRLAAAASEYGDSGQ